MADSNHPNPEHSAEAAPTITATPKKKGRTTTKKKRTPEGKLHVPIAKADPLNPGKLVYEVPIQHKPGTPAPSPAIIYTEDYERLISEETCPRRWYDASSGKGETKTPTAKSKRRATGKEKENHVRISWLILGVWREDGVEVSYADGDRHNLRRDNLVPSPRGDNPHVQRLERRRRRQR